MKVAMYEERVILVAGHSMDEIELTEEMARKAIRHCGQGRRIAKVLDVNKEWIEPDTFCWKFRVHLSAETPVEI